MKYYFWRKITQSALPLLLTFSVIPGLAWGAEHSALSVKVKGVYFRPSETSLRNLYNGRWSGEGEFNIKVFRSVELWLVGNLYSSNGKLPFTKEKTKMTLTGIGGGVKLRGQWGLFNPYLGIGPLICFYKEENPIGIAEGNKIGYIGQGGFYLTIYRGLLIDFCFSYTRCKAKPQKIEADLGGIHAGIGLGYAF